MLERLQAGIAAWRAAWAGEPVPVLQVFDREGGAVILDTRPCARRPVTPLSVAQNRALAALDRPRSREAIDLAMQGDVAWLVERGFVIDYEKKLVSIVVRPGGMADANAKPDRDGFAEDGTPSFGALSQAG